MFSLTQYSQDVAPAQARTVIFAPSSVEEFSDQRRITRDVLQQVRQLIGAVIVCSDADMLDTGHLSQ